MHTFAAGADGHDPTVISLLWACFRLPGHVLSFITNAFDPGVERAPQPTALPRPPLALVHTEPARVEPVEDELVNGQPAEPALAAMTETVAFSLDGTSYEIDLSAKDAAALRGELRPYTTAARRLPGRPTASRPVATAPAPQR